MKFGVIKSEGEMLRPATLTPAGRLPLSTIDQLPALRRKVQTLHVFINKVPSSSGSGVPAEIIKSGLTKALVHYYPLAGRLLEDDSGCLHVDCTGDGIWYVQASANHRLDELEYLDGHPTAAHWQLLPDPPRPSLQVTTSASSGNILDDDDDTNVNSRRRRLELVGGNDVDPLVLIQVTSFPCNGFVMGLEFSHTVCDGLGAAQFLNAVAELARGHLPLPSIPPVWARNALVVNNNHMDAILEDRHHHPVAGLEDQMQPPSIPPPGRTCSEQQLQRATFDVSIEQVAQLKRRLMDLMGRPCSAFEVLTAAICRSRARAMVDGNGGGGGDDDDDEMRVVFFVNARSMVEPPLPEGFYGNCFFPVNVTATAGRIRRASLGEVVGWIQQGKGRAGEELREWVGGRNGSGSPFDPPLTYKTVLVSEWGRLGFGGVDFGWGPPAHIIPMQYSNLVPGCILCTPPPPKTGIRLMTWCLYPSHLPTFSHQLLRSLSHID